MSKYNKEVLRYILLTCLSIGLYFLLISSYTITVEGNLSEAYAGIVTVYLGVWGYIVKWFFNTYVDSDTEGIPQDIKDVLRYVLLAVLSTGTYYMLRSAYELQLLTILTNTYSAVVGVYVSVWGFTIKWFFLTKNNNTPIDDFNISKGY